METNVAHIVARAMRTVGLLLLVTTVFACARDANSRTIHVRIMDLLYGANAPIPLGTANLPRDAINGDTRPVLIASVTAASAALAEHARVPLDVPRDAVLELAYGARGRGVSSVPADAEVQFHVEMKTASGSQTILHDELKPNGGTAIPWKAVSVPLPAADGAMLIFTSKVPSTMAGAVIPEFAAPVITVPARAQPPRSVVLISLDTLRADHLGLYGYERQTSPLMDQLFGREGVVVDRTYSQAANTPGGHVAMLKGVWPTTAFKVHGARFFHSKAILSLAEVLRGKGYRTAGFTEDALLDGPAGFNRGFDDAYYEEMQSQGAAKGHIEKTFDRGLEWLAHHRNEPVFLFFHTYQVHHPYTPPPEYAARFPIGADVLPQERDLHLYDAEIAYTDQQVARLITAIDALGRRDDTLIVVTSDHGEEFAEHGRRLHGSNVTDEILHVPMLLRAPGLLPKGVRRDGPMALMDLPPTVLDLLGFEKPDTMHGRSVLKHLRDGDPLDPQPIFSEAAGAMAETYGGLDYWYPPSYAVTVWPWRMARIRTDNQKGVRYTLFNLAEDPGETKNLFDAQGAAHDALRVAVDLYEPTAQSEQMTFESRMTRDAIGAGTVPEQDPAREEKMRALGYIH